MLQKSLWMKLGFVLCMAAGLMLTGPDALKAEAARDGILIHISQGPDSPHRVLMALNMAKMMSADRDVLVYFDIKGIEVVVKDAPDITFSHFPSSKEQLAILPQKGVTIMACPGCLKAAGKTPADLAEGVMVADKDRFFNFTKGRIVTLDY